MGAGHLGIGLVGRRLFAAGVREVFRPLPLPLLADGDAFDFRRDARLRCGSTVRQRGVAPS